MPDVSHLQNYARLLRLTPIDDVPGLQAGTVPPSPLPEHSSRKAQRWPVSSVSFLLLVVLPVCLCVGYFWLLAADRYESEVQFVLRTSAPPTSNMQMPDVLKGSGMARASDEGYVVKEYLVSRDAMAWIESKFNLREIVERAKSDPLWSFPNWSTPNTNEGLYRYFQRLIYANFDDASGVSTLKVQAFTPADAQRLAAGMLEGADVLVNRLNERARKDAVRLGEAEVVRMRQRTLEAQAAITAFREREHLIDPKQATLAVLETIGRLATEAAQISVQISEFGRLSPQTPQLNALRTRHAALEEQIAKERERLAGDVQSIAPRIAEYEKLILEREFSGKALLSAMATVEAARTDALRQQIYMEKVSGPSRPDYPAYPWKIVWCLVVMIGCYMVWRIWRILSTDALHHNEI